MSTEVYVGERPKCDICRMKGINSEALYDAATVHGPWAYMCQMHFNQIGVGLGTGRGQRLLIKEKK